MSGDGAGIGNPHDRELQYYRRECNELGARLLRLQEEQSQTYREARRSRTVVRLVRETYRIGDLAQTAHDVGGPTLEVIVDNALCDSAVFLREEPRGGGRFLVAHAIGIAGAVADVVVVSSWMVMRTTSARRGAGSARPCTPPGHHPAGSPCAAGGRPSRPA